MRSDKPVNGPIIYYSSVFPHRVTTSGNFWFLHDFFPEPFLSIADGAAGDSDLWAAVGRAGGVLGAGWASGAGTLRLSRRFAAQHREWEWQPLRTTGNEDRLLDYTFPLAASWIWAKIWIFLLLLDGCYEASKLAPFFTNLCLHLCFFFFFWNDAFMLLGSAAFWRPRPWCPTVLQEISEQAVSWVLAGAKALGEILVLVDMAVLSFKGANVLKKKINPCRLPWNRLVIRLFFYLNTMTHSSPMCLRKQKIGAGEATADCCHLFQKSVFFISKSAEQYLSNYEKHPARNQGAQSKQEHVSPWFPEVQ